MLRKNQKQVFTRVLIIVAIVSLVLTLSLSLPGWADSRSSPPKLEVKACICETYGELAARAIQCGAKIPADENHPIFSEGEVDLSIGQKGPVWFLAGSWEGRPIVRTGTVPEGKALFVPIFAVFDYNAPGETDTEEEMRAWLAEATDLTTVMRCTVDGEPSVISYPTVRVQSPRFSFTAPEPPEPNLCGSSDLAVCDGYWVIVPPLPVGEHEIHSECENAEYNWGWDVTYNITVVGDDDE